MLYVLLVLLVRRSIIIMQYNTVGKYMQIVRGVYGGGAHLIKVYKCIIAMLGISKLVVMVRCLKHLVCTSIQISHIDCHLCVKQINIDT